MNASDTLVKLPNLPLNSSNQPTRNTSSTTLQLVRSRREAPSQSLVVQTSTNIQNTYNNNGSINSQTMTDQQSATFCNFFNSFRKTSTSKLTHSKLSHRDILRDSETISKEYEKHQIRREQQPPPRVSRLLHAVEDRDAKQSRVDLSKLCKVDTLKEFSIPRDNVNADRFKLVRNASSIPQLKTIMCGFIDSHRKFFNKDVVNLPNYERTAPFSVARMTFADACLDDRRMVEKKFGYDEDNLSKNHLLLEKILLERMLKNDSIATKAKRR